MGKNSSIEWTDHTFNPWVGCSKVSPACDGCFAEHLMDTRHHRVEWGQRKTETTKASVGTRDRTSAANWKQPIKWNKDAGIAGTRPRVFCASLADVFDNQVPPEWRADLFELIRITPNLIWLLLTKRPQNIVKMVDASGAVAGNGTRYLPGNAALGTTIEDQTRADINVPALLHAKEQTGPAFVFVSCEPLLGPIELTRICGGTLDALRGHDFEAIGDIRDAGDLSKTKHPPCIDLVIAGGETDQGKHKARPSHPDWFRSLRDQCAAAGTEFHFKQHGDWIDWLQAGAGCWTNTTPQLRGYDGPMVGKLSRLGVDLFDGRSFPTKVTYGEGGTTFVHVGKKLAGRLLDGREHNGMPEPRA